MLSIVVLIVLVLFVVFILPVILGAVVHDIKPPDTSDLLLGNAIVPEKENSYYDLLAFGGPANSDIKPTVSIYEPKETLDFLSGTKWDDTLAREIISRNSAAFAVFDLAMKKAKYQDPAVDNPEKIGPSTVIAPMNTLRVLSRIQGVRALYAFKHGNEEEGFMEAMKLVDFGQKIQDSQGVIIHYLVGLAVKDIGFEVLRKMISSTTLPPEQLLIYVQLLDQYRDNKDGLIRAFKAEFINTAKSINVAGFEHEFSETKELRGSFFKSKIRNTFYFMPNDTKRMYADYWRSEIKRAEVPCSVSVPLNSEFEQGWKIYGGWPNLNWLTTKNIIGKALFYQGAASFGILHEKRCSEELLLSADRLLLALKAYRVKAGELPDSLESLVPQYIPSVSHDPFDGNLIRYSKTKKILYSVGKDGKDSGGSIGSDWRTTSDPTFEIN